MPEPSWKKMERLFARAFGAERSWANSGERLDFDGPNAYGQVKEVKELSLAKLTALAEEVANDERGKTKLGVVGVKLRRGRGRSSPPLVVITLEAFQEWFDFKWKELQ